MIEISTGAVVLMVTIIVAILPAGIFIGRLSQRVDTVSRFQNKFSEEVKIEFRELRKLILFRNGLDKGD